MPSAGGQRQRHHCDCSEGDQRYCHRRPSKQASGQQRAEQHRVVLGFGPITCDLEELGDLIADLEADGKSIPVLLRQYLKLGGQLLAFNVDPKFGNCLDGLIVVDLSRTDPRLLDRYMGTTRPEW